MLQEPSEVPHDTVFCTWSSHFQTACTLTSFLLSHTWDRRYQTVNCLGTLESFPYLFFPLLSSWGVVPVTCGPILFLILDRKFNKTLLSMETLQTSLKDLQKSLQGTWKCSITTPLKHTYRNQFKQQRRTLSRKTSKQNNKNQTTFVRGTADNHFCCSR